MKVRQTRKLAAALSLVASVCALYLSSGTAGAVQRRAATEAGERVNAGAVYEQHCARCHGEDGRAETEQGQLYGATNFADANWWNKERPTDARLRRAIARGRTGGMPAFAKRLSTAEINALATYVRGFRGR